MNTAARPLFCLFIAVLILLAAGCTTVRNDTVPDPLARFALVKEDMPFAVATEDTYTMQDFKPDALFNLSRPAGYYEVVRFGDAGTLSTGLVVRQVIYKFPSAGDAENEFSAFHEKLALAYNATYMAIRINRSPVITVGDRSEALTIQDYRRYQDHVPASIVVFTKGNYLEIIALRSPQEDPDTVADLAMKAALRLPEGRYEGNETAPSSG
jgi:hypothetical protein